MPSFLPSILCSFPCFLLSSFSPFLLFSFPCFLYSFPPYILPSLLVLLSSLGTPTGGEISDLSPRRMHSVVERISGIGVTPGP